METLEDKVNEQQNTVELSDTKYKIIAIAIILGLLLLSYWWFRTDFILVSWVRKVIYFIGELLGMILGIFG